MSQRLIPNSDNEFALKATMFAQWIEKDPARYSLTEKDALAMTEAATRFASALQQARSGRSVIATRAKDDARAEAAKLYKRCVDRIRVGDNVNDAMLISVGLRPRSEKRKSREVPQEPPRIEFVRAFYEESAMPMHELKFKAMHTPTKVKPEGAARLELFVDLIPPDEQIPRYPGQNLGGRPWYLRSYSRSPIRVAPPICRVPMLAVYWGRWADAIGNVGPFSQTVVSRIEGWSPNVAMHLPGVSDPNKAEPPVLGTANLRTRDQKYSVAVLDAQFRSLQSQEVVETPALEGREQRKLEGPAEREAA